MNERWQVEPPSFEEAKCRDYFLEYPVFRKLFRGFQKKYDSYNALAGKVKLWGLKPDEREALEGFFQKSFHGKKSCTISADLFVQALQKSRFSEITPERVVELCLNEPLVGKKELQLRQEVLWQKMLCEVKNMLSENEHVQLWFAEMQTKVSTVKQFSEERTQEVRGQLLLGASMVESLPVYSGRRLYLPVYAAQVTGNPHAFDKGTAKGRLLDEIVEWHASSCDAAKMITTDRKTDLFPAFSRLQKYLQAGILLDDVSNYVMLSGVIAVTKDDSVHPGMEGFCQKQQMVFVPLAVLADWKSVRCPEDTIYIVENPSVFAMLCARQRNRAYLCMNGQPRLSSLLLLQILAKSGITVYYSGDLDPEGLLIADKLKQFYQMYQGKFYFWKMSEVEYEKSLSDVELSDRRLAMLDRLTDAQLIKVADRMRREKKAGYQENLL